MSYSHGIWSPNREHSKVFKAIFVLCIYATHSFIFVNNIKKVHRRQPYPNCYGVRHITSSFTRFIGLNSILLWTSAVQKIPSFLGSK